MGPIENFASRQGWRGAGRHSCEKRNFQFRWEAYNAFNHTQYSGLNVTARFDPAGNQTNALFGTVTSTRTPRVMQGSLRFTF